MELIISEELTCFNGQVKSGEKLLMVASGPTREAVEAAISVRFPQLVAKPAELAAEPAEEPAKGKKAKAPA